MTAKEQKIRELTDRYRALRKELAEVSWQLEEIAHDPDVADETVIYFTTALFEPVPIPF